MGHRHTTHTSSSPASHKSTHTTQSSKSMYARLARHHTRLCHHRHLLLHHRAAAPRFFLSTTTTSSTISDPDPWTIGLVREHHGTWERRVPLAPSHVRALTEQGCKVLVQPSFRRVFTDSAYAAHGAIVQEDLSPASVVLGVKQVPMQALLPRRTYLFFSHTIKGQEENMALLDTIRAKHIRLIDYECITENGERGSPRLVAFGRFAGIAGFVDILQGLGQQLLAKGYNTPFLHSPFTYMYADLEAAKQSVKALGKEIATHGLPREMCPLVIAFTGKGKVSQGAQEMFKLLPHEWVEVEDLPNLVASFRDTTDKDDKGDNAATGVAAAAQQRKVYGVRVKEEDLVEKVLVGNGDDDAFSSSSSSATDPHPNHRYNRAEYRMYPERYRPVFHERVAPYISLLVNGMYWDPRFPRLLTRGQLKTLCLEGRSRLLAVADISCDVEGSIEFLARTTELEQPFLNYHAEREEVRDKIDGTGVVVGGVDILPAQLPKEASLAFGEALLPLLPHLLGEQDHNKALPPPLEGAVITDGNGELTQGYKYIEFLRAEHAREKKLYERIHGVSHPTRPTAPLLLSLQEEPSLPHVTLQLRGHLFDSGFINQVLDVVEARGGSFLIAECLVQPNKGKERHHSTIVLEIEAPSPCTVRDIICRVQALGELLEAAEATVTEMTYTSSSSLSSSSLPPSSPARSPSSSSSSSTPPMTITHATVQSTQRVLVLGAGRVSGPAVEYLARNRDVVVVGATSEEVARLGERVKGLQGVVLDMRTEGAAVRKLVEKADVVLSLLPAPMHPLVARDCLSLGKHLVTTSYISDELRQMHKAALSQGLVFLNEAGLDPGMDHASAMRIIDTAKAAGGKVVSFRSICGGLPSPEAASKTPFLYKFSWSPRAVLSAAENAAVYRQDGRIVHVEGPELLRHVQPCPSGAFPTLRLEVLPNRDALVYQNLYGIPEAQTCFRGTLRYAGWSDLMYGCKVLGLLDHASMPAGCASWHEYLVHRLQQQEKGGEDVEAAALQKLVDAGVPDPAQVLAALAWLGVWKGSAAMTNTGTTSAVIDAFSALLEERLRYGPGEVDMVAMRHDIVVEQQHQEQEQQQQHYTSSLLVFGNDKDTAMSLTVGKTAAVATDLVLSGELRKSKIAGVIAPTVPQIYLPLLDTLAKEGLAFDEQQCTVLKKLEEGQGEFVGID